MIAGRRSSFYWPLRLLAPRRRQAMFAVYDYCRALDDIVDGTGTNDAKREWLARWRCAIEDLFAGRSAPIPEVAALGDIREGSKILPDPLFALIDGMEMDIDGMVAPDRETLTRYCDRVAGAVGLLAVAILGHDNEATRRFALVLGEALQRVNILRDIAEDAARGRLYLPREDLQEAGIDFRQPVGRILRDPQFGRAVASFAHYARAGMNSAVALRHDVPRPLWPALAMMAVYARMLDRLTAAGWPRGRVRMGDAERFWLTSSLSRAPVAVARLRIIGAGLAGLAAAVVASRPGQPWSDVAVEEAAPRAGGRCRSFADPAFDEELDNGVHVLVTANRAARAYLEETGAPEDAFVKLFPPFRFAAVDGTRPGARARIRSIAVAAFNTEWSTVPFGARAGLAIRAASGPVMLVPRRPLADLFVRPALALLARRGVDVRLGARAGALDDRPTVLAVPPWEASRIVPGLETPDEHRAIVTVHYACPGARAPTALGMIGGTGAWLFRRGYGLAAVASAADSWAARAPDEVAAAFWKDIQAVLQHPAPLPPWRVVKERRATFAWTRRNLTRRAPVAPCTLAGDWTAAGYPGTIEGAVRSGFKAARDAAARVTQSRRP